MKKITILALDGGSTSSITGAMEVFHFAGLLWNVVCGKEPTPHFQVTIVSPDGTAVKCINRLYIEPHCAMDDVTDADLIMICAIADDVRRVINKNTAAIDWL